MEITKPNIHCWLLIVLLSAKIPSILALENPTFEHSKRLGLVQESHGLKAITRNGNGNGESVKDDMMLLAKGQKGGRGNGGGNLNHTPRKSDAPPIEASCHMMIFVMGVGFCNFLMVS